MRFRCDKQELNRALGRVRTSLMVMCTVCAVLLLPSCANLGGSEIPNGCAGIVTVHGTALENGKPRSGVIVTAFQIDYIPFLGSNGPPVYSVADSVGRFTIPLPGDIAYNLLFSDALTGRGAFKKNILADSGDTVLNGIELDSLGAIEGKTPLDTSKLNSYFVFVAGSPFFAVVGSNTEFAISGLPPETYNLSLWLIPKPPVGSDHSGVILIFPNPSQGVQSHPAIPYSKSVSVGPGAVVSVDSLNVSF